jgi:hypothetical protein
MFKLLLRLLFGPRRGQQQSRRERRSEMPTDWAQTRSPPSQFDLGLLPLTEEWMASLPHNVQPHQLATRHRRLTNRLALCWNDQDLTERVLDELLLDQRGGTRKGFSAPVAAELMALREHLARQRKSSQVGKW